MEYEELSYRRMLQVVESSRVCRVATVLNGAPYLVPLCCRCRMEDCTPTFELRAWHDGDLLRALAGCSKVMLHFERTAPGGAVETVLVRGRAVVEQCFADAPERHDCPAPANAWQQEQARWEARRGWEAYQAELPQHTAHHAPESRCPMDSCGCGCGAAQKSRPVEGCPGHSGCRPGAEPPHRCGGGYPGAAQWADERAQRMDQPAQWADERAQWADAAGRCGCAGPQKPACSCGYCSLAGRQSCACGSADRPGCGAMRYPIRITVTAEEMTGRCHAGCIARCRTGNGTER